MTYEQLQQVESNPLVPRTLIVEAVMARLKVHENPNAEDVEETDNPRYVCCVTPAFHILCTCLCEY